MELACALTSAGRFADTALHRAVGAPRRLVVGPLPQIRCRPTRRRRGPEVPVFAFFSSRLGCLGSLLVSLIGTAILVLLLVIL